MTITLDPPTPVVPPVDDATRREFLTIIGAAGLIAACGDDARDGERAGSAAAEARTVAGVAGLVQIPIDLQRVVNVNNSEVDDDLGALGIVPVGIGFPVDFVLDTYRGFADAAVVATSLVSRLSSASPLCGPI